MLAIRNISSPTITGSPGKKNTDPTAKAEFPINWQSVLNVPIFVTGLSILNSG
jgi:hypothetical protein